MKLVGTIALSILVIVATLIFLMLSFCAIGGGGDAGSMNSRDRKISAAIALVDAGVIAAGVWAIGRLNRKT